VAKRGAANRVCAEYTCAERTCVLPERRIDERGGSGEAAKLDSQRSQRELDEKTDVKHKRMLEF